VNIQEPSANHDTAAVAIRCRTHRPMTVQSKSPAKVALLHAALLVFGAVFAWPAVSQTDVFELEKRVARGDAAAQNELGWRHHTADGVPKDDPKALELLKASAEAGYASAMVNLGYFYQEGIEIPVSEPDALALYEKAAQVGCYPLPRSTDQEKSCQASLRGKVNLALMLAVGKGRLRDVKLSRQLLSEAVSAGYTGLDAKLPLAGMLFNAEGGAADTSRSLALYKEAAATGDATAARDLGTIYYRGIHGVKVDLAEARRWYQVASATDPQSKAAVEEISAKLATWPRSETDTGKFVQSLRTKYSGRIHFETAQARRVVENFAVDCQSSDGRVLPLMNIMLAKLASMDRSDMYLTSRVDSRGEDVRIYDEIVQHGRVLNSIVMFEINKWGELRSPEIRMAALRNACFGSYGPIWKSR
jgi:TPR repeat protein